MGPLFSVVCNNHSLLRKDVITPYIYIYRYIKFLISYVYKFKSISVVTFVIGK